jgi:hypothetical protein
MYISPIADNGGELMRRAAQQPMSGRNIIGGATPGSGITGSAPPRGAAARRKWLENKQANITRDQWNNFLDVYKPVETDLVSQALQTDFSTEGDEAGQDAAAGVRASQGMLARNLSRMGTSMTPEQAAAVRRRANLQSTKATAKAENTTRRTLSDSRTNLLAGLVGVGRGVATGASAGFNSAANNAANTEMMLNQGAAQAQATNIASASALTAALIMMV